MLKEVDELQQEFDLRLRRDKDSFHTVFDSLDLSNGMNPLALPLDIWGNVYWEFMDAALRDRILSSMLRYSLARGIKTMPVYQRSEAYASVKPSDIQSLSDLNKLPVLLKDGDVSQGVDGFRKHAQLDPHMLRPVDVTSSVPYDSGGAKGMPTPTHITPLDMEIEGRALAYRCFLPGGLHSGVSLYNFYNPTHKGGRLIEEAAQLIGKNHIVMKRPEDDLAICMAKIKVYDTRIVAAVQPPLTSDSNGKKGGGVSFLNLFGADHTVFGRKHNGSIVHRAFITGFQLPEPVITLSQEFGMDLFPPWGASEALPGATSTVLGPKTRTCQYNNQHLIMGPHLLSVVTIKDGVLVPAKVGETGIVLVTTIARQGTLFFNYAIGDKATVIATACDCGRTTPIIGNIHRVDNPSEIIEGGCRFC